MAKKIRNAPGWLGISDDRMSFVFLPERAEIVQQIFELNIGGFGNYAIANLLNKRQIPGFGSSKRWDKSTIHNMLTSRATFGEYRKKQIIDGKEVLGNRVPNHYPAVISPSTFEAARLARQSNMASRSGRRGKVIANLFFGLTACSYCSRPMKVYGADRSLICSTLLSKQSNCPRFAWTYSDFESTFFHSLLSDPRCSEFSALFAKLLHGKNSDVDLLEIRMKIANYLKSTVKSIMIAVAGIDRPAPKPESHIRRDNSHRFFEVTFADGRSLMGFPRLSETPPPAEPSGRVVPSVALEKPLSLSPRQAQITSLLVRGFSLKQAAEKLGQTLETGRWHLRAIFRRTNTHSQSELIKLAENTFFGDKI